MKSNAAFSPLPLLAGALCLVSTANLIHAKEPVDLRGYGRVEASITPQRSEFFCESVEKADILLGKLLADLFWDAGKDHAVTSVELGGRDALVHEWAAHGAVMAARNDRRVLVIGGGNAEEVVKRAESEPLLAGEGAVFAPATAYPRYLDFFDLRAVHCFTLGLHSENRFRYQERAAFTEKFFPGGLFHQKSSLPFAATASEHGNPALSLLDADVRLAEKARGMCGITLSIGAWPRWAQDKWPEFLDRPSPLYLFDTPDYAPEALGMTGAQRRQSSLKYLGEIMRRHNDSAAVSAWHLYVGNYLYETFFMKHYQGQLGHTAVGQADFKRWLREERGFSLADLGLRWHGNAGHYKSWDQIYLPHQNQFIGNYNTDSFQMTKGWEWKKSQPDDDRGWRPVKLPPSQQQLALPAGRTFWRTGFDATDWLRQHRGKEIYLVCNVDNIRSEPTDVTLNGVSLGKHQSEVKPYGPISLNVTGKLRPGTNQLLLEVSGRSGGILGPVFLTTTQPKAYPYLGKHRNAQYLDSMEWRLAALNFKVEDAMAYARSIDPDRPFVLPATTDEVRSGQTDSLRLFGGSMQDTGYETSFRPFNSRLGYAAGFYGSVERSGIQGIPGYPQGAQNLGAFLTSQDRTLSSLLFNAEGAYSEWRDPYAYFDFEKETGWFTKNRRAYQLIGKFLPEKPQIALLHSSQSAMLGYELPAGEWLHPGRLLLPANHYDNVYITERMLVEGLAGEYPVLMAPETMIMSPEMIAALRRYVENGGTFIATHNTGRHGLLEADAWPISEITGYQVVRLKNQNRFTFGKELPVFKGCEGRQVMGEGGIGLKASGEGTVDLARWDDGSVAVGMRQLGKGRVITLGSPRVLTFWQRGTSDIAERLFTDLGVKRSARASKPEVFARKVITKNGLQEWLVGLNYNNNPNRADLAMAVSGRPAEVRDMLTGEQLPFTYADGWLEIKDVPLAAYEARIFGIRRGSLSEGIGFWWHEKTKFWTRRYDNPKLVDGPAADVPAAKNAAIVFDQWKFHPDRDGAAAASGDWLKPDFNAQGWRDTGNDAWNLQFEDLQDYSGMGLYRSAPFNRPTQWKAKQVNLRMLEVRGQRWNSFEWYLNGRKLDNAGDFIKLDITGILQDRGNVLAVKLTGRNPSGDFPLSGLLGTAIWIEPETTLNPSLSLLGTWQAVQGDWKSSKPVNISGKDRDAVTANHLVCDVRIPAEWQGRRILLHVDSPRNTGLTGGMLMINGTARDFHKDPASPTRHRNSRQDEYINITPYLRPGQSNRIELWPLDSRNGGMNESNIIIHQLEIGCAVE
jgi:hypothetical protein